MNEHFEIAGEPEQLEHHAPRISAWRLDNESCRELRDQSFQGRGCEDLVGRGVALDTAVFDLPVVQQMDLETTDSVKDGVLLPCVKEGRKLRARVVQDGYHPGWNMRFPRSIREDGTLYVVDEVNTAPETLRRTENRTLPPAQSGVTALAALLKNTQPRLLPMSPLAGNSAPTPMICPASWWWLLTIPRLPSCNCSSPLIKVRAMTPEL